jgi:hypothetical protein
MAVLSDISVGFFRLSGMGYQLTAPCGLHQVILTSLLPSEFVSLALPFLAVPLSPTLGDGPVEFVAEVLSSYGLLSSTCGNCELTAHMN